MSQTPSDTFKLSYPFTTAGTRIEQVELETPDGKDLKQVRKISKTRADWDEPLIARSTGLLPEDLDNMDLADYLQLQKRFQLITGMGESDKGADAGAGLMARWFRFQPGRLMPSILTIWRCGWSRLKSKSKASTATNHSTDSRQ